MNGHCALGCCSSKVNVVPSALTGLAPFSLPVSFCAAQSLAPSQFYLSSLHHFCRDTSATSRLSPHPKSSLTQSDSHLKLQVLFNLRFQKLCKCLFLCISCRRVGVLASSVGDGHHPPIQLKNISLIRCHPTIESCIYLTVDRIMNIYTSTSCLESFVVATLEPSLHSSTAHKCPYTVFTFG